MFYPNFPDNWSTLRKMIFLRKQFGEPKPTYQTVKGDIVSFETKRVAPLRSLRLSIDPVQAGTGDPSPDNVRPISGWTEANLWRTGKNLFPDAGNLTVYQTKQYSYANPIIFKGQTVTVSVSGITFGGGYTSSVAFFLRKNKSGIANVGFNTNKNSAMWTATEDVYGVNFYATSSSATNPGITTIYHDFQLELGPTPTPYAPYTGNQFTIQLGQTVYGGTLDVTNGVLTVDRANIASYNGETLPGKWISDRDVYAPGTTPTIGAQVVYELATPITIPLSSIAVTTLKGQNVVWGDAGEILELTFRNN